MKYKTLFIPALVLAFAAPMTFAVDKISPMTVNGAKTVDAAKAKALFDKKVVFVDTRNDKDWDAGRIPGAMHLDINKGAFTKDTLGAKVKKDQEVVMYCNGEKCLRSSEAAEQAVGWGFTKVYYFRDGFPAWQDAGYPVE
ncbi:MAG: rhodanese-like domain-containing protein [Pseudomonadota bacterium]